MNSITPLVEQIFLYQVRKNIKCGAQNLDVSAIRHFKARDQGNDIKQQEA